VASPQCENGYTKIANELFEAVYCKITNSTWIRLVYHTIRLTYGWHRKEIESNYQAYATRLHLSKDTVKHTLHELMDRKIVVIAVISTERFIIAINKDYERWRV